MEQIYLSQQGTYNVTFNRTTGEYNFASTIVSDNISFYGGFNSNATPGESLSTPDGITYSKTDFYFNAANVKFYKSNAPIKHGEELLSLLVLL